MLLKDNVIDLANDILLESRFDNDVNDVLHPLLWNTRFMILRG